MKKRMSKKEILIRQGYRQAVIDILGATGLMAFWIGMLVYYFVH